jgi:hypothetical protein
MVCPFTLRIDSKKAPKAKDITEAKTALPVPSPRAKRNPKITRKADPMAAKAQPVAGRTNPINSRYGLNWLTKPKYRVDRYRRTKAVQETPIRASPTPRTDLGFIADFTNIRGR